MATIQCEVTPIGGEYANKYTLVPIKRKVARKIYHELVQVVAMCINQQIENIDFEKIDRIGHTLLGGCAIETKEEHIELKSAEQLDDYFFENPDEFYLAIVEAAQANFPNFFQRLAAKTGFDLRNLLQAIGLSDTPSMDSTSKTDK